MCWLQIAKRTQRLYIALNLRLSFVETSSRYLVLWSGRQRGSCLTDWLVTDWLTDAHHNPAPLSLFWRLFLSFLLWREASYTLGAESEKKGLGVESACDSHIQLPRVRTYSSLFSHDTDASPSASSLQILHKQRCLWEYSEYSLCVQVCTSWYNSKLWHDTVLLPNKSVRSFL